MEFTAELRQLEAMQGDLPDSSATDRAKKDFAELKKDFAKLKGDDVEIANAEKDLAKAEKDLAKAERDLASAAHLENPDNETLKAAYLAAIDTFTPQTETDRQKKKDGGVSPNVA